MTVRACSGVLALRNRQAGNLRPGCLRREWRSAAGLDSIDGWPGLREWASGCRGARTPGLSSPSGPSGSSPRGATARRGRRFCASGVRMPTRSGTPSPKKVVEAPVYGVRVAAGGGMLCEVRLALALRGRTALAITVWHVARDGAAPRLVTAYPRPLHSRPCSDTGDRRLRPGRAGRGGRRRACRGSRGRAGDSARWHGNGRGDRSGARGARAGRLLSGVRAAAGLPAQIGVARSHLLAAPQDPKPRGAGSSGPWRSTGCEPSTSGPALTP